MSCFPKRHWKHDQKINLLTVPVQMATAAFPVRWPKPEISDLFLLFTTQRAAGAGAGLLTCTVRRGQRDGGNPRNLAIGRAKEILDFFEEDSYAFGEGVREADRNESADDHHPTPTAVRWTGGSPHVSGGGHGRAGQAAAQCSLGNPETQSAKVQGQPRRCCSPQSPSPLRQHRPDAASI